MSKAPDRQPERRRPQAVVIGAGLLGVTTAFFLRHKGFDVDVIEERSRPAMGTSYANAGQLAPFFAVPNNRPSFIPTLLKHIWRGEVKLKLDRGLVFFLLIFVPFLIALNNYFNSETDGSLHFACCKFTSPFFPPFVSLGLSGLFCSCVFGIRRAC